MLFNSLEFVALVTGAMCLYYLPPLKRLQVPLLILASFIFYAWHEPFLLILLAVSASLNAVASYKIVHGPPASKRAWAWAGVVLNLGVLGYFKYAGLLASTFVTGSAVLDFALAIPLPVGISFYTFQGISLVLDVEGMEKSRQEKNHVPADFGRHWMNTVFFISFFPQLVAGPIVKARDFLPQIGPKTTGDIDWNFALEKLILGFFLKSVIADHLQDQTASMMWPHFMNGTRLTLVFYLFGYSAQIFADFAGYSLIAMGVAALFGYRLPVNFNYPYIARSFSEFWQRWHISLSTWLRDYLYFPLGGNRKGRRRTYINLMIVMALGGLWHGAAWSYMIWGLWHGLALAIERIIFGSRLDEDSRSLPVQLLSMIMVFLYVSLGWVLFKLPDFSHVIAFFKALVQGGGGVVDKNAIFGIAVYATPVFLYHVYALVRDRGVYRPGMALRNIAFALMLFLILVNRGNEHAFIYFQF